MLRLKFIGPDHTWILSTETLELLENYTNSNLTSENTKIVSNNSKG